MDRVVDKELTNNVFLKLNLKNLDRVKIRMEDISGNTNKCHPDIPTRMQLIFVNTNSQ